MGPERRRQNRGLLLKRDGPLCPSCGVEFTDENPPTIAHLIARAAGGSNSPSNLGLLCRECQKAGREHPASVDTPASA